MNYKKSAAASFLFVMLMMLPLLLLYNDIFDKNLDSSVERTKERPLVVGSVSTKEAWGVFFLLVFLFCLYTT